MACQLAESPKATLYIEGFSRFVTSTTAPIATGWSDSCRAGLTPAGRPCLCTAHKFDNLKSQFCDIKLRQAVALTPPSCDKSRRYAILHRR